MPPPWPPSQGDGPALLVLPDAAAVAAAAADLLVDALGRALVQRGRAVLALSGGRTPLRMYRLLADARLDWPRVHVVQVDERFVPEEDPDRNWRAIQSELVAPTGAVGHPMPVRRPPREEWAVTYAALLGTLCDGVVDACHLGLGADGHTASLVPGDPVVDRDDVDVALTGPYEGRRRMTMTAPLLNRSGRLVWQVVGGSKRDALCQLHNGHGKAPAQRIRRQPEVWLVADTAAARMEDDTHD
ncbi:MAG TPA: 6-phosphogluconolactonase [Euzebya sp.]|nr:6-phosphogluconolactonase [Euzebya sp.]